MRVAVGLHAEDHRGDGRPEVSTTRLQGRLVNHLMGLDQRFFQDNPPGALIERVRGDTLALQKLATTALMAAGRDSITLLSLLAVMLVTDWTGRSARLSASRS
jgi:ABC-type multidrug transport system fused ATPase/permease subunit